MKIRSSLWTPLVAAPIGVFGVLPLPLVEPDVDYTDPALWYLAGGLCGLVLLIGLAVAWSAGMRLEEHRFLMRGKYGRGARCELEEGERWVIAGYQLCLQRRDGSLVKLRVPKWAVNRREWQRLEAELPVLDSY
jgi:hypothetical protein